MKQMGESHRQILALLKTSEAGLTVEDCCRQLGVTPMAVHRPLRLLQDQGLVTSRSVRDGRRGRPTRIYKLAEAADDLFPKHYSAVLLEFLNELQGREGMARLRTFFANRFEKLFRSHKAEMKGKNLSSRTQTVSQVLDELNYMVESEETGRNEHEIRLFNCPIAKVAKAYPQICQCEQKSLSALLQAEVARKNHILSGHSHCSYVVRKK